MSVTHVRRRIDAPIEAVFDTVADIRNYSKANPDIIKVEFLSDTKRGVGTRFREVRRMKGREAETELEVTELVEPERVRMVADSHGTVWDSVFQLREVGQATEIDLVMTGTPSGIGARIMNFLISPMLRKAVAQDMDRLKTYCEAGRKQERD